MTEDYRVRFDRDYSDGEHALFAEYEEARAQLRPQQCTSGDKCWVRFGPPYYRPRGPLGGCAGCGGRIKRKVAGDHRPCGQTGPLSSQPEPVHPIPAIAYQGEEEAIAGVAQSIGKESVT